MGFPADVVSRLRRTRWVRGTWVGDKKIRPGGGKPLKKAGVGAMGTVRKPAYVWSVGSMQVQRSWVMPREKRVTFWWH